MTGSFYPPPRRAPLAAATADERYLAAMRAVHETPEGQSSRGRRAEAHNLAVRLVNEKLSTKYKTTALSLGGRDCRDSPTGACIYDNVNDPDHVDCIFCHYPREMRRTR